MEENISSEEDASKDSPEEIIAKPLNTDGVKLMANGFMSMLGTTFLFLVKILNAVCCTNSKKSALPFHEAFGNKLPIK